MTVHSPNRNTPDTSNRHPEAPEAYYAFDDEAREVLIKRYDTPTPWINYLSNGQFHTMMSQATATEAQIWLNTQTWSVISGMPERARMIRAMDSVAELLDTELGIRKIHPPIVNFPTPEDPLSHYNKGCGENGAIFCHANTWAIIAEAMLGRGDRAWKYYRQLIPAVAMAKAGPWRYKAEPYVYASNFFGPESDRFGLANVSWLTGTAAWMYVAVTQHILGIRPTWQGLEIAPCLPAEWERAEVTRRFRGASYRITIEKPRGICQGPVQLWVDGQPVVGSIVPAVPAGSTVTVLARMEARGESRSNEIGRL